jgi:hypothetical protein
MVDKLKKALPLALAVGGLAFAWIEAACSQLLTRGAS